MITIAPWVAYIFLEHVRNDFSSNFVPFPIVVHGNRVNTVQAVWAQDPKEVPYETHVDFYKYIANAVDDPIDYIHFRADAPLDVKAVM